MAGADRRFNPVPIASSNQRCDALRIRRDPEKWPALTRSLRLARNGKICPSFGVKCLFTGKRKRHHANANESDHRDGPRGRRIARLADGLGRAGHHRPSSIAAQHICGQAHVQQGG
jgi:hypothetical protein